MDEQDKQDLQLLSCASCVSMSEYLVAISRDAIPYFHAEARSTRRKKTLLRLTGYFVIFLPQMHADSFSRADFGCGYEEEIMCASVAEI